MQDYEFTVVIERDEDGRFVAICPALQGCYTEGETEAEARDLIADAIRLHVESRIARPTVSAIWGRDSSDRS
jgi:predicted RNase H-like HicB family nuclease